MTSRHHPHHHHQQLPWLALNSHDFPPHFPVSACPSQPTHLPRSWGPVFSHLANGILVGWSNLKTFGKFSQNDMSFFCVCCEIVDEMFCVWISSTHGWLGGFFRNGFRGWSLENTENHLGIWVPGLTPSEKEDSPDCFFSGSWTVRLFPNLQSNHCLTH